MRLLVIPVQTKLVAASPFHCCLVSPGSKKTFLRAFRTMLTSGVSPIWKQHSVTAITGVRADWKNALLAEISCCNELFSLARYRPLMWERQLRHSRISLCFASVARRIDKAARGFENRILKVFSEAVWPIEILLGHRSLLVALTLGLWLPSTAFPKMRSIPPRLTLQ